MSEFYFNDPITQAQWLASMCATGLDDGLSIGADRGLISSHIPTPAPFGSNHLENLELME